MSYDCELVGQTYQKDFLKNTVSPFMRGNYSGVIIGGCSSADLEFLHTLTPFVPVVLIDRTSEQYSTVGVDNRLAGVSAAELIKKAGHSSVAVIRSENSHIGQTPRFNAFLQACRNMEITVSTVTMPTPALCRITADVRKPGSGKGRSLRFLCSCQKTFRIGWPEAKAVSKLGEEDYLLEINENFHEYLKSLELDYTWHKIRGPHGWGIHGEGVRLFLEWFQSNRRDYNGCF